MKSFFLMTGLLFFTSNAMSEDQLPEEQSHTLFKVLYEYGGDRYCSANYCRLKSQCIFDRTFPSVRSFNCEMNDEILFEEIESQRLFKSIFENTITMDGKCSANYCDLTAECEYSRLGSSQYYCEIY